MSDAILTLKSPGSFSAGTYIESKKALCGKSLATTEGYNFSINLVCFTINQCKSQINICSIHQDKILKLCTLIINILNHWLNKTKSLYISVNITFFKHILQGWSKRVKELDKGMSTLCSLAASVGVVVALVSACV